MRQNLSSISVLQCATGSGEQQSTPSLPSGVPCDNHETVDETIEGDAAEMPRTIVPQGRAAQSESDQPLIDAVLAGDTAQFNSLVMRYANRLYHFILKNVGHVPFAQDLTQETLLEAYRQLSTFRGEATFSTWLFGIALNKVRNYINRSPDWRQQHSHIRVLYPDFTNHGDPTQLLETKQTLQALQRAIETLPMPLRESLILVVMEELPYETAAQILAIPVGTLKSRVHRSRELLKQSMRLESEC